MEEEQIQKPLSHETIWGVPETAGQVKAVCPLTEDGKCQDGCSRCMDFEMESGFSIQGAKKSNG